MKSAYGTWPAGDREMLEVRVAEVYALDKLSEVSKSEIFAKAFGAAAEKKARAVANLVMDPEGTAKAVPGAVARFAEGPEPGRREDVRQGDGAERPGPTRGRRRRRRWRPPRRRAAPRRTC